MPTFSFGCCRGRADRRDGSSTSAITAPRSIRHRPCTLRDHRRRTPFPVRDSALIRCAGRPGPRLAGAACRRAAAPDAPARPGSGHTGSMSSRNGEIGHAERLHLELQGDRAAEQQRARDGAQRMPLREDHQRHRDEAARPPSSTPPTSWRAPSERCAPAIPPSTPATNSAWYCSTLRISAGREGSRRGSRRPREGRGPSAFEEEHPPGEHGDGHGSVDERVVPEQRPGRRTAGVPRHGMRQLREPGDLAADVAPTSSALSPTPQNMRARPLASWFARRVMTRNAKIRLKSAPARRAGRDAPAAALPVCTMATKPTTAPISITPSRPRFTTPARSPITSATRRVEQRRARDDRARTGGCASVAIIARRPATARGRRRG